MARTARIFIAMEGLPLTSILARRSFWSFRRPSMLARWSTNILAVLLKGSEELETRSVGKGVSAGDVADPGRGGRA